MLVFIIGVMLPATPGMYVYSENGIYSSMDSCERMMHIVENTTGWPSKCLQVEVKK